MRVIVLGGGPCGLGAAWRLNELEHPDWAVYECAGDWGGLAGSQQDENGFWWDYGGHVLFSHYGYFDRLMDNLFEAPDAWLHHRRESWVRMHDRFIPYPLQQNIRHLPKDVLWACLQGLLDIHNGRGRVPPANFDQWIEACYGVGLAECFMRPYNKKVWAFPLTGMSWEWIGERVAPADLGRILHNMVYENDERAWGPNAFFRFPRYGGTGAIWRTLAGKLPAERTHAGKKVLRINPSQRKLQFNDGSMDGYDSLISTIPLDRLLETFTDDPGITRPGALAYSSTHVIGLALRGRPVAPLGDKCWMYFPEKDCPFYRATVFSNYSPNNVPDSACFWSLLLEVSEPGHARTESGTIIEAAVQGALRTGLIKEKSTLHHTWYRYLARGYPIPTVDRNQVLLPLLRTLGEKGIFSRGRFGAWRYEVGNMDHSFMQGVECVNTLLNAEEELTVWNPSAVNDAQRPDQTPHQPEQAVPCPRSPS